LNRENINMFKSLFYTVLLIAALAAACQFNSKDQKDSKDSTGAIFDSIPAEQVDTGRVIVPITDENWKKRLLPIEDNVNRINGIKKWTNFFSKELDVSTEGGDASFFQNEGNTEKIVVNVFGETFQEHNEYYLLNNQLSFVFEKRYVYNRPMYYDSTAMKENNDSVTFDFDKSTVVRNRYYFEKGKIVYASMADKIDTVSSGKSLTEESSRILELYGTLQKLGKSD
jgi:hypothetical protein